jgi:hypothetical protein
MYSLYDLWKKRNLLPRATSHKIALLNLIGLALFLAISSGPRFFRISTVAPPSFLILVWLLRQPGGATSIFRITLWSTAAALALWLPIHRQVQWHRDLTLPIGETAFSNAGQLAEFRWLKDRTQPGDRLFNDNIIGLYLQLENPTRADLVNNDDFTRPEEVTSIVQSLRQAPPRFIVLNPQSVGVRNEHDHSGPFQDYVQQYYCPLITFRYGDDWSVQEIWGACLKPTTGATGGD